MIENKNQIGCDDYLKLYACYIRKEQKLVVMYMVLIFTRIKIDRFKVAEVGLPILELKQIRKILCVVINTSKKDS